MFDPLDLLTPSAPEPWRDPPAAVTCAACGCRLQPIGPTDAAAFVHFAPTGRRDARGCLVDCVELAHDVSGRPFPVAALA